MQRRMSFSVAILGTVGHSSDITRNMGIVLEYRELRIFNVNGYKKEIQSSLGVITGVVNVP